MSIQSIALAFVAAALAQRGLVWWDVADLDPTADEELRQRPAEPAGTFDSDSVHGPQPAGPVQHGRMAAAVVGEVVMFEVAAAFVQRRRGEHLAMGVEPTVMRSVMDR